MLPDFSQAKVLVVGDVMLDRYWFGDVNRISPEAPVPVLKVGEVEERPGGAANVARNIAALGGQVMLLSIVGDDEPANCLETILSDYPNLSFELHRELGISTIIKLRAIARHQQLLRIDFEAPPSQEGVNALLLNFQAHLSWAEVVVFSDYGKGSLVSVAQMIALAREHNKVVLVDPKGDDYSRYQGATLLTPNRGEFKQVAGGWSSELQLASKAQQLRVELGLEALLLTRSEEGMSLYSVGEDYHEPAHTREVFDVSGAGDTVIAGLAVMVAVGAEMRDAVMFSNRAAGIVVGKLGTAVVTQEEVVRDMMKN